MPITRDESFPPEAAQLMAAFSRCAGGHDMEHVTMAAGNMFSASLHNQARAREMTREAAAAFFRESMSIVLQNALHNFDRGSATWPSDIPVRTG